MVDTQAMSRVFFVSLLICLFASTGCMVLDEIDSANAKMESFKKAKPEVAEDDSATLASKARQTKNQLLEESKQWWDQATSLAPAEADSSIVTCRIRGGTQFMSKDDCLTRGGVPKGISG